MRALLRWGALALVLALIGGLLAWTDRLLTAPLAERLAAPPPASGAGSGSDALARAPMAFTSSADCLACHAGIGAEWLGSPHARPWGTHPHLPKDPLRLDCSPCHIPEPIYERGLDAQVLARVDRHHEGVDCIACHAFRGESLGTGPTREAPCNPRHEPTISTNATCAPCHALHGTHDEWARSQYAAQGITCQDCHMPRVTRDRAGEVMGRGRSHRMLGGRDPELVARALALSVALEGDHAAISLTNDGAGHAVPGEINNRSLILAIAVAGAHGAAVESRRVFQAPPRPRRGLVPTTQIMPGETVRERAALPRPVCRLTVSLEYRLFFLWPAPPYRVLEVWRIELFGIRVVSRRRAV